MKRIYLFSSACLLTAVSLFAGNPDCQGEAGAYELLINPWARSAGLHTLNTASVVGAEAIQINVAGLSRIDNMEVNLGHTRYLVGADMNLNALGFANRVGKGAFGVQLSSISFGKIQQTTVSEPEGTGATFSPSFFTMALSYAQSFENKVSVGVTAKMVNESISNASARAIALDAGVQYVAGEKDRFKFGISLRNIGNKMFFTGEGLNTSRPNPDGTISYPLTYYNRSAGFELPSQLNIGTSYDWPLGRENRITLVANFTSNSFSRNNVGAGLELAVAKSFALRAAYKTELGVKDNSQQSVDNGLAAGLSFSVPTKKGSDSRIWFDYAYRNTRIWHGIHNLCLRLTF